MAIQLLFKCQDTKYHAHFFCWSYFQFIILYHVPLLCFQGVTSTIFENQPSLNVVSNGADCLLLSKQFFTKHCSEKMLTRLKEQVCYMNTVDENHCKCDRLRVCVYPSITISKQLFYVISL